MSASAPPGPAGDPAPRPARAASGAPLVSVIVPVYGDPAPLDALLRALDAQTLPADRFECLLVDNGCVPPLAPRGAHAYAVRVEAEPRPGSYAARNRGAAGARGEILAFTDADCTPRPDWLASAAARLATAAGPIVLGGAIDTDLPADAEASVAAWHCVVNDLKQARLVSVYGFAATANMVTRRSTFEHVGPFDEELLSGGDLQWGRRATARGVALAFCARAAVGHAARTDAGALVGRTRRIAGGHHAIFRRGPATLARLALLDARIGLASLRRIWCDPRVPSWPLRLRMTALELRLRWVYAVEALRLHLGGRPTRR